MNLSPSQNMANILWNAAAEAPDQTAVIMAKTGASLSFGELRNQAASAALRLSKRGVGPGDRVLVMLNPGLEFFAAMFAVSATGATAVLVDPGMGFPTMFACLESINPRAIIAERLFHLLAGLHRTFPRKVLRLSRQWLPGCEPWSRFVQGRSDFLPITCAPTQIAALAFTSGSTGAPKPVVMDHETLAAQVAAIQEISAIEPGQVQMSFVALTALLGPGLRCTTVIPSVNLRRLHRIDGHRTVDELRRFHVTHAFTSPFVWKKIADALKESEPPVELALKRIFVGGAPPSSTLLRSLKATLSAEICVSYGATEAVPISSCSAEDFLQHQEGNPGAGCLVGRPVQGIEALVICDDAQGLRRARTGEVGEVFLRGPLVSPGYEGFATSESRVLFEDLLWHPAGDMAFFDEQERIVLCGRKSEVVPLEQAPLFPHLVEPLFDAHPGVRKSALVNAGERRRPRAVLIVSREPSFDEELLRHELSLIADDASIPVAEILFRQHFPTDVRHRSKIRRGELARWAARKLPTRQLESQ